MYIKKCKIPAAGDLLRDTAGNPIVPQVEEIQIVEIPNLRGNNPGDVVVVGSESN